ncbi:hypothetical protein JXO52_06585 [bacterium]|nr:hypothetical protein [bacterium]
MNIFILDEDVPACARYHCDQHVVKMILESVQILCTALSGKGFVTPYRPTHRQHPCVLWTERSYDNFLWLRRLALELNGEYRYRFGREQDHKSITVLHEISGHRYERQGLTEFAQAMPAEYRVEGDAVAAYRRYYIGEKLRFARWTKREIPGWIPPGRQLQESIY